MAWTGLTAAALWAIPGAAHRSRAIVLAAGVFGATVLLHAAWDGLPGILPRLAVETVSFIAVMIVIHRSTRDRNASGPAQPPPTPTSHTHDLRSRTHPDWLQRVAIRLPQTQSTHTGPVLPLAKAHRFHSPTTRRDALS